MKTCQNRKSRTGCTGTPLTCTGTLWPKMTRTQSVPVQVQSVPVQVSEKCPECVFSPIFMHFSIPNQIYTSYTLQNHFKFILYPQLYSNHLSMDIFLPNSFMNHFKNHSNMGYNPYTNQIQRFVKVCSKP